MPVSSRAPLPTLLCALVGWALLTSPAHALAPDYRARLDTLFTTLETHQRMMGTVTIRRAGRVIYQRSLGHRDSLPTGWVPADQQTMYRVGSVAKPFTAVMIYQLVHEQRLSLDTRLSRFFPRLPNSDSIAVRDLLAHTSGLGDPLQGTDVFVPLTRDSILRRIEALPVQFQPGTRRRYNNGNYLLLGYIIESITRSPYERQLQRRVLGPIGLRRTRVGGPVVPERNEARAYYFGDGRWELQRDQAIENGGAAGALVTTTHDLTRFLSELFRGRLIPTGLLHEMTTGFVDGPRRSGKGLGPFVIPDADRSGFSHDGSIGAHTALIGYVPSDSLALALTVNGHNYPINRIFFHAWSALYGTNDPMPAFTPVPLTDAIAAPLLGAYSAPDYGLVLTVRRKGDALEGQVEGQSPFPLTYIGRNRFMNEKDGILMHFADPVDGVSPRFRLFQQKLDIAFVRRTPAP